MFDPRFFYDVLLLAAPLLFSLTIHEYAHARTALAFGDPTAKNLGRVTLNPLAHLDPIGTIALFVVHFGWAKPVPVNPGNLRPRRFGDAMVSLAGPLSNLGLAVLCGLVLRAWLRYGNEDSRFFEPVSDLLLITTAVNVMLCVFNLVPLYPLDGHHILREMLPHPDLRARYMHWQVRYGRIVLLVLIFAPRLAGYVTRRDIPGPIGAMFGYVIDPFLRFILGVGGNGA